MRASNRGMALVSVVLILATLMILSLVLVEKVWQTSRGTAAAGLRQKTFWAANSGLERVRRELALTYRASQGWQNYLQGGASGYQAHPAWRWNLGRIRVEVYLQDNPDGDNDVRRDNDLQLFVLVRAYSEQGPEVLVEARCGLDQAQIVETANPGLATTPAEETEFTELMTDETESFVIE